LFASGRRKKRREGKDGGWKRKEGDRGYVDRRKVRGLEREGEKEGRHGEGEGKRGR